MEKPKEKIYNSLRRVEQWVEDHHYKGYEPFDGLASYLRYLTFNSVLLERFLMQSVRRIVFNVRPLIGVPQKDSTKGRGYMASGYMIMFRVTKDRSYLDKATMCLDWLDENKSPYYEKHSWGNHFMFCSRGGRLPAFEPIIVWTSLIGQAFIDGYELTHELRFLKIIRSICDWIMAVPREVTKSGSCLSYVAPLTASIHNSNMLGAAMLARAFSYLKDPQLLTVAKEAIEYSCSRQLSDGSWWYGEPQTFHWIDNFHTAYNLDSLKAYSEWTRDRDYDTHLRKAFSFYKDHFFELDGTPRYYHNRTSPIDSQCISQSIETLANFSDYDKDSLPLGLKVANWAIDNMQDKERGYFYFRKYPLGIKNKTPMLHWAQATTYKGLALLFSKL